MTTEKRILLHGPIAITAMVIAGGLVVTAMTAMNQWWTLLIATVIMVCLAAFAGRVIGRHIFFAIVPVTLLCATIGLLFFVDSATQRLVLIGITGILTYGVMLGSYRLSRFPRDAVARGMVVAAATSSLFFFFSAVFAIYLNYVIPGWWVAMAILLATIVVTWQYFVMIAPQELFVQTVIYSIVLGMVMMEAAIAALWWPFGYLTTSIILLMIYYIVWDLGQSFFLDRLSKTRLFVNIGFFLALAILVLLTAQWLPVV